MASGWPLAVLTGAAPDYGWAMGETREILNPNRPFTVLEVAVTEAGVAVATVNAPPINVMTARLMFQLANFAACVRDDPGVRVAVLRSDDPDFFIAHFDVQLLLDSPRDGEARRAEKPNHFHQMCEAYRTCPKPTLVEIGGRVGGGGHELSMACDMRFGALGRTVINQMEVPLGILPGGTGTQHMPRLIGTGRAMEIILGGDDIDAQTAADWGLLNRALPPEELRPFVDRLAARIASFPPAAVARAKASLLLAEELPLTEGMVEEAFLFEQTMRLPESRERMAAFLARGGQTRDGEAQMADLVMNLGEQLPPVPVQATEATAIDAAPA